MFMPWRSILTFYFTILTVGARGDGGSSNEQIPNSAPRPSHVLAQQLLARFVGGVPEDERGWRGGSQRRRYRDSSHVERVEADVKEKISVLHRDTGFCSGKVRAMRTAWMNVHATTPARRGCSQKYKAVKRREIIIFTRSPSPPYYIYVHSS